MDKLKLLKRAQLISRITSGMLRSSCALTPSQDAVQRFGVAQAKCAQLLSLSATVCCRAPPLHIYS